MWKPCKTTNSTVTKAFFSRDKFMKNIEHSIHKHVVMHAIDFFIFVKRGRIVYKTKSFHKIFTIFTHTYPHIILPESF